MIDPETIERKSKSYEKRKELESQPGRELLQERCEVRKSNLVMLNNKIASGKFGGDILKLLEKTRDLVRLMSNYDHYILFSKKISDMNTEEIEDAVDEDVKFLLAKSRILDELEKMAESMGMKLEEFDLCKP